MNESKHRIVILGGGFAGLHTAIELHKRRTRLKGHEIILIDKQNEHVYTPLLYEVSAGLVRPDEGCSTHEMRSAVSVSLSHYDDALRKCCFSFVRGEAVKIHHEEKEVELKDGRRISYDMVVSALGSTVNTYGIPGVQEYALFHKTMQDVVHVNQRVCELTSKLQDGTRPHVHILVAGAGPTGVELAAELAVYFRTLEHKKVIPVSSWSVRLLTSDAEPLKMCSVRARKATQARLTKLGVDFHPNARIKEVRAGEAIVTDPDGEEQSVRFDQLVWTAGVRPMPGMGAMGIPVDAKGFAVVEPDFRMSGRAGSTPDGKARDDAFALGDAISYISKKTNTPVPMMAQVAVREASIVAENIVRRLERRPLVVWNPPERWATVVPVGGTWAIADLGKVVLTSVFGFAVRKAADLSYFMSVMPWRDALRVWRRGSEQFGRKD